MAIKIVVGAQWGDEGKGKIVDLLSADCDVVARYQGGANAGHTVKVDNEQFILHLLPSGILHPNVKCYIGNGVVVDPAEILREIEFLATKNISVKGRLFISGNAHTIFPYHTLLDQNKESDPNRFLGTTGRGIGPAYTDKVDRIGIRMLDLLHPDLLRKKVALNFEAKAASLSEDTLQLESICDQYIQYGKQLEEFIADISTMLHQDISENREILLEGAQGALLDVDFGTYPYVTSSNPIAGSACIGVGIGPTSINQVIGVMKAYSTRVGEGPFPTEFDDHMSEQIRELGQEFGATTGRPRRCGWFDGVLARFAARINGLSQLAITKLDVLDSFESIKVCTSYLLNGQTVEGHFTDLAVMQNSEPVYETVPGWQEDTSTIRNYEDLPQNAKNYIQTISKLAGVPVQLVSVGSDRCQTIFINGEL